MAESDVKVCPHMQIKQFIECPNCLNTFDDGLKQPWYLPCLHTFCSTCLQKPITALGRVECPLCKEEHKVKKLDDLMKNNTWRDTLDYFNANHKRSEVLCENCINQKQAVYRCLDCSQLQCSSCHKAHQKIKCLKDHRVIDIEPNMPKQQQFVRHHTCSVIGHEKESLKLFCKEKSCSIPICVACVSASHRCHAITDINEIYIEREAAIQEANRKLQERNESISGEVKIAKRDLMSFQLNANQAEQSVVVVFDEIIQCLEQRKEHFRGAIQRQRDEKEAIIQFQINQLALFCQNVESALVFLHHKMSYKNALEFINLAPLILGRLRYLQNKDFDHVPLDTPELQFNRTSIDDLKAYVMRMGELELPPKLPDTPPPYFLPDLSEPENGHFKSGLSSLFGTNADGLTSNQHGQTDKDQTFPKETEYFVNEDSDDNSKYLQDEKLTNQCEQEKSDTGHLVARGSGLHVRNTNANNGRDAHWSVEDVNVAGLENMAGPSKNKAIVDKVNKLRRSKSVPSRKCSKTNGEHVKTKPKSSASSDAKSVNWNDESIYRSRSLSPRTFSQQVTTSMEETPTPADLTATASKMVNAEAGTSDEEYFQRPNILSMVSSTSKADPVSPSKNLSTSNPVTGQNTSDIRKGALISVTTKTTNSTEQRRETSSVSLSEIRPSSTLSTVIDQSVSPDVEETDAVAAHVPEEVQQQGHTSVTCPPLELDEKTLPTDFNLSEDKRILSYCQQGSHRQSNQQAFNTHVGVIASKGFEYPDNVYFEVELTHSTWQSGEPMDIFAMWFTQKEDVKTNTIEEWKYKVIIKSPSKESAGSLSANFNGMQVALPKGSVNLGVNINTPKKRIEVIERRRGILIGKKEGVDFSQKLWPVFQICKDKTVHSLKLHSGDIEKIPLIFLNQ